MFSWNNLTVDSQNGKRGIQLLLAFAFVKLFIHLITNLWGGYGIFRDELYYIACSNHLDIGYVDQPPLSIYVLALNRLLLGDAAFALRLLPAIAGAAAVFLTGLITRELGGRVFAQMLACIASIVSIINLAYDTIYSMNAFDVLFWTWAAYITVKLINSGDRTYWLQLGIVLGLGSLNKIGVLWFGGGIFIGFLFTSNRSWYRTKWPWIAGTVTLLLFMPFIVWNAMHDFAHLEFIRSATQGKYSGLSPWTFIAGQALMQNPVTLPLWLAGISFFLVLRSEARYRPLGIAYVTTFVILILNGHSKSEYLSPAYGMLFAAGGIAMERWLTGRLGWLRGVYAFILAGGLLLGPAVLPILPVETYIKYAEALGMVPSTAESKQLDRLPQFYADMFGWEDKAAAVAQVFHRLTREEQSTCAIFADNYGRCGALDFFGKKYGLPPSIGRHNNYWLWGSRDYTGDLVIVLGGELNDKQEIFESVDIADTVTSDYCMPYENNLRIYLCRKLKMPVTELWRRIKNYD